MISFYYIFIALIEFLLWMSITLVNYGISKLRMRNWIVNSLIYLTFSVFFVGAALFLVQMMIESQLLNRVTSIFSFLLGVLSAKCFLFVVRKKGTYIPRWPIIA